MCKFKKIYIYLLPTISETPWENRGSRKQGFNTRKRRRKSPERWGKDCPRQQQCVKYTGQAEQI
jgi:hypothetical protein